MAARIDRARARRMHDYRTLALAKRLPKHWMIDNGSSDVARHGNNTDFSACHKRHRLLNGTDISDRECGQNAPSLHDPARFHRNGCQLEGASASSDLPAASLYAAR